MADPNLDLDTLPGGAYPAPDTSVTDPSRTGSLLSPGETGPQSSQLSPTAAKDIQSRVPVTARTTEDKAAIAHLADPYREAPRAQPTLKNPPSPSSTLASAVRNKPAKTAAHQVEPARDHGKWGEPSDAPPPELHQAPNIFSSIGQWFGNTNFGSATQQILGRGLKEHTDQWYRANNEQRAFEQNYHHKQIMDHAQELQSNVKDTLLEAKSILEGDPKEIIPRLHELAQRTHNSTLEYKINNGGAQAAFDYLSQMDRFWQGLNLTSTQLQKQETVDQNQAPAYEAPDSTNLLPPKPPEKPGAADTSTDMTDPFSGRGGTAPIIVAPLDQPTPGAAAQQPSTAAPAAPAEAPAGPAPYEIPGEPSTPTGDQSRMPPPASGSPGAADMAALQPDQGIQVAEAGMSDVAPSWAKEMPNLAQAGAQPPTPPAPDDWADWTAPPSNLMDSQNARTASGRILRNRDYIRRYALDAMDDPASLDRLAKTQPDVANKARQMASEMWGNLREIASSRRRPGPGMIRAINSQFPGLGDEVKRVADGDQAPPGAAQLYGARGSPRAKMVASLVGKYDPSMLNPIAYRNRAAARQYWSVGKGGDMMLAQGAAYLHGFALLDSLEGLRGTSRYGREFSQYDPPVGGDWLRQRGLYPSVQEGKDVANVIANARVFMNEAEAVLHKGAPTVAGVKTQEEEFDVNRMNVDVLRQHVQTYIDRLRDKMQENIMRFHAGTAQGPDQLDRLFREYVSQGQTPRAVNGRPVMDAIHKMIIGDPSRPDTAPQANVPNSSIDDIMKRYGQ